MSAAITPADLNTSGRTRLAWAIRVASIREVTSEFAPSRNKARARMIDRLRDAWEIDFLEAASAIKSVRREPHRDVRLPARHPVALTLSAEDLHTVSHAYGGCGAKAGYRDHYFTHAADAQLLRLADLGLFTKGPTLPSRHFGDGMAYFTLTDLGKAVAAGEVETYP